MKSLAIPFLLAASAAFADEQIVISKPVVMFGDHTIVAIPAGSVAVLVGRNDQTATLRFKGVTGTVPLSKLPGVAPGEAQAAAPAPVAVVTPKPTVPPKPAAAAPAPSPAAPARVPQTAYGRDVQKARDNAAKHNDAMVKPADAVMDGP
jgi:hypothetical protein